MVICKYCKQRRKRKEKHCSSCGACDFLVPSPDPSVFSDEEYTKIGEIFDNTTREEWDRMEEEVRKESEVSERYWRLIDARVRLSGIAAPVFFVIAAMNGFSWFWIVLLIGAVITFLQAWGKLTNWGEDDYRG